MCVCLSVGRGRSPPLPFPPSGRLSICKDTGSHGDVTYIDNSGGQWVSIMRASRGRRVNNVLLLFFKELST